MSEAHRKIEVYQTNVFKKTLNKLTSRSRKLVEDEIEKIIQDPEIGPQKRGDLNYMRVHKFSISNKEFLLGYNWNEGKITLTLLALGPHENFYRDAKRRRRADIGSLDK